jgi:hypothetical protein
LGGDLETALNVKLSHGVALIPMAKLSTAVVEMFSPITMVEK